MIYYGKLFDLMKVSGKNKAHIRSEKKIGKKNFTKTHYWNWHIGRI